MYGLSRIDQLFNEFMPSTSATAHTTRLWQPNVDVRETAETIEVSVEVPGVAPENIDASITGNLLTIKGEKSREVRKTDDGGKDRIVESSYGSFIRRIRLPNAVDPESVTATSEHGVLRINLRKRDLPKRIDIQFN